MRQTVTASTAEIEHLRNQVSSLRDRVEASEKGYEQVEAQVAEYRGKWLLADFRVKQLSSELLSAGHDLPEENETQRDAQNKMYCHSLTRSSSKRPGRTRIQMQMQMARQIGIGRRTLKLGSDHWLRATT
jgi:hypothetical protein